MPKLSAPNLGRVCRAAIAAINVRDPGTVRVVSSRADIVRVRHRRPDDGSVWTSECTQDGDKVVWRAVDAFGPGSGPGRWRTHPMDEVLTFRIDGSRVDIIQSQMGEEYQRDTFTIR